MKNSACHLEVLQGERRIAAQKDEKKVNHKEKLWKEVLPKYLPALCSPLSLLLLKFNTSVFYLKNLPLWKHRSNGRTVMESVSNGRSVIMECLKWKICYRETSVKWKICHGTSVDWKIQGRVESSSLLFCVDNAASLCREHSRLAFLSSECC